VTPGKGAPAVTTVVPLYIAKSTRLYKDIRLDHGKLPAFGINLANSVKTHGLSWPAKSPYIVMILIAIALQYFQMKQLSGRNPAAAQANPQMQQMQKVMPLIFAVIYIAIPAGVNVYFIVSSLFRISQQEFMYRRDPHLRASMAKLHERSKNDPKMIAARAATQQQQGKGLLARLRPAALTSGMAATPAASGKAVGSGADSSVKSSSASTARPGSRPAQRRPAPQKTRGPAAAASSATPTKAQPRAQGKRARRPR
jgi:YidC/Oxa1 family membrane protein insertase